MQCLVPSCTVPFNPNPFWLQIFSPSEYGALTLLPLSHQLFCEALRHGRKVDTYDGNNSGYVHAPNNLFAVYENSQRWRQELR
jgi:hypothetical protein